MDFADKRPPPKTTAQAFELAFDPDGDNVFVLSSLFPQAFGRKLKKKEEKPLKRRTTTARSPTKMLNGRSS